MNNMKQILGVTKSRDGTKSFWTKIGVAYENKDGSFNMKFDFIPTNPETTIQLRDFKAKESTEGAPVDPTTDGTDTPF